MNKSYQFNINRAIAIVAASIFLLAAILFLRGCGHTPTKPVIIPAKKIIATVKQQEQLPDNKILAANTQLKILESKLTTLSQKLYAAQQQNRILANRQLLPAIEAIDTIQEEYPDHIVDYVDMLVAAAASSDSICNDNISNLKLQLLQSDTAYNWQVVKYNMLKNNFELATTQQAILEQSNKDYRRALRRKKFSNVVWKAALIAAGGFIILKK